MKIEKLIERIKAGDTDALKTIYEAYSQRMRNVCIRITQEDEDTVSDLVQESFIRAYYSLGKLKDASKFGEWIIAITKNVSLRYLERKHKNQMVPFSAIEDGFDVESSLSADYKLVEKELLEIIDQLPSGYRKVFRMAVSVKKDSTNNILIAIEKDTVSLDTVKQAIPKLEEFIAKEVAPSHKSKWQLLTMGSLGSALAQNAYKMLMGYSGGGGEPDGPQPSGPQMFSTWEEYYQYLQQNAHGDMSEEEKALMEIAINNTNNINNIKNGGKIIEHEYHDKPITFGLSMTKTINRNWNMEIGLQYSLLKSKYILGEDEYYIQKRQKIHYLGIPLRLSYKWLDSNRWTAYSSVGILLNIPLSGKTDKQYVTGNVIPYTNSWHFTPSFQWTIGTGVGLQYNFANNWGIYIEPTFSWYIPNGSTIHTIWTEHPFSVTVPFGIRFTW